MKMNLESTNGLYLSQKLFAEKNDGIWIEEMALAYIPHGWVVDGGQVDVFWEKLKRPAIPIRPSCEDDEEGADAREFADKIKGKYGDGILFVLMHHNDTISGWLAGSVLIEDLDKDMRLLIEEGCKALLEDNLELYCIKHRATLLLSKDIAVFSGVVEPVLV